MTVPLRPVSSGRLLLRLPADDLEVQVSGAPAAGGAAHFPLSLWERAGRGLRRGQGEGICTPLSLWERAG